MWVRAPAGPCKHCVAAAAVCTAAWAGKRRKAFFQDVHDGEFKVAAVAFPVFTTVEDTYDPDIELVVLQGPQAALPEVAQMLQKRFIFVVCEEITGPIQVWKEQQRRTVDPRVLHMAEEERSKRTAHREKRKREEAASAGTRF